MQQCGPHDFGVQAGSCGCPPDGDPRPIVSKLAGELEAARKALLAVADVFGYQLTDEEVTEQIREGWTGVPERAEEDLSDLRHEVAAEALRDFADRLIDMSKRGVNERITGALAAVADIARRRAVEVTDGTVAVVNAEYDALIGDAK